MDKKAKQAIFGTAAVVLVIITLVVLALIKKYTPNK